MAHFALLDENDIVFRVIVIDNKFLLDDNGEESENIGVSWILNTLPITDAVSIIQTSYNSNFRSNYASIGGRYDRENDVFIPAKPEGCNSWLLDENTWQWVPPIPFPSESAPGWVNDGRIVGWMWDDESISWVPMEVQNITEDMIPHG